LEAQEKLRRDEILIELAEYRLHEIALAPKKVLSLGNLVRPIGVPLFLGLLVTTHSDRDRQSFLIVGNQNE